MYRNLFAVVILLCLLPRSAQSTDKNDKNQDSPQTWSFAISGDSRNCGDVVMPAIAADAMKHNVAFYWHLGDLRLISGPDQDFIEQRVVEGKPTNLAIYQKEAWGDFVENQIKPWGETPFYLGIGNHETIPPKTRALFIETFREYLNRAEIRAQRLKDDPSATEVKAYFHWIRGGVDFINLDNATADQFDAAQMKWLAAVVDRDAKDDSIRSVVVGMHKALPESISFSHSMNESPAGTESGRAAYGMLLKLENESHKNVYVLASHSHFFMDGTYNTDYWRSNGGVLPGWIIGTAGAERYPLPENAGNAKQAKTNVYGYLIATVNPEGEPPGTIRFKFEELKENDIPRDVVGRFTPKFVHECFVGNRRKIAIQ